MIVRSLPTTLAVLIALVVLAWMAPVGAQSSAKDLAAFLPNVQPAEVIPGADRFGPVRESPAVAPAFRGDELVGHVYLTSQFVDTNGYSSKPIHIVVGLDLDGTIRGARLVAHSEPIVLIGIPEHKIVTYLQSFVGYNPTKSAQTGQSPPQPDIVSGATVTVLVMGESVVRSALRVTRALQAGGMQADGSQGASQATPIQTMRVLDPKVDQKVDWKTLLEQGAVRNLRLTVGEVNKAFERSGNQAAVKRPEPGPAEAKFIELYVALVSQPSVGRSLLGEAEFESVSRMLQPGQHAILIAAEGSYSFKGSGYVRGGIFDRIQLIQGAETIRFRDREHRRIGGLAADGAPSFKEIDVFIVPAGAEFDPVAPWRLQLLVQRAIGALEKTFVSFELPYELPARYTHVVTPDGKPVQPASADSQSAGESGLLSDRPLWQRLWYSKAAAIAVLGLMLIALTLIFFFQDLLVKRERLFDRIRLLYLAITLVWLGWVAQAQLSVVNVLTFTTALREGFEWKSFLVDPLIFILWSAVAVALLFWGRGPFCGWLCPFGALQELSNRAARKLKVPQLKIPWRVHERLWPIKYVIFLVLFGVSLGSLAYAEMLSEIEPFKTAIVLRFMREWWFVAFALALLIAGLFVERFFCRYLCPLGAALAIPGRLRMFDWLKRYRECGNPCMRCFKECPVEAIHPEGHINPNECISCLHCQVLYHHEQKCPVLIQRKLKRKRRTATAAPPLGADFDQPPPG